MLLKLFIFLISINASEVWLKFILQAACSAKHEFYT